jgi:hypothetical protein
VSEEEKQDEAEPEFLNRAERRAAKRRKGGAAAQPHQHDHGKGPTGGDTHGAAGARRNYGTRRTGG